MLESKDIKEYLLEEEDCILVHGIWDPHNIIDNKKKLIKRIEYYHNSFNESKSLTSYTNKDFKIYYTYNNNSRSLIQRLFTIEKRLSRDLKN